MGKNLYSTFPHIVADEIILRKIVPRDVDALFEIYSNPNLFVLSPNMIKKNKATVENMIGHFERDFSKGKEIFLGICESGSPDCVVGVAEIFDYNRDVNMVTIGYRLNEKFGGKGIATKAVQALIEYLFTEIGINRIQAFVMPQNEKSLNVLRRSGFVEEGTIRQGYVWKGMGTVDLTLFSMLKVDYDSKD